MKNLYITLFSILFISLSINAQIVVFHPVKVPSEEIEKFIEIETNYSKKTAQDAVNNGNLEGWALLRRFNPDPDGYNFMWVNIYKDIKTVVEKGSWWGNSEKVLGIKPSVLYDYGKNITADRRYYYEMELQINGDDAPAFVIFNFTTPSDVDAMINQTKKYVMPHFSKNMNSSGMVGWGLGKKITPQGEEFSSVMTYDSYDSLENVMLHLAGKGIIEGLPFDKLTPVDWTMRPIMSVLSVTDPRE